MASEDGLDASTEDRMEVNTDGKACEIAAPGTPGFGGVIFGKNGARLKMKRLGT